MPSSSMAHGTYPTYPIVVRVLEARNLKAATQRDYSVDPYCIVAFKKSILKMMTADKQGRFQSRILENTLMPTWNEEFILHPMKPETDVIVVKVYDRDRSGKKDTLLGKVNIPIVNYWNKGMVDQWLPLGTTLSKTGHGEIHLLVNYNEQSGQTMKSTGLTGMNMMGQGILGSTSNVTTTTTTTGENLSSMPGSSYNTGSVFQSQPQVQQGGYVQTTASYPPPMGTHGDTTTNTNL